MCVSEREREREEIDWQGERRMDGALPYLVQTNFLTLHHWDSAVSLFPFCEVAFALLLLSKRHVEIGFVREGGKT